jgi:predicted amidohydrolase YtcJ
MASLFGRIVAVAFLTAVGSEPWLRAQRPSAPPADLVLRNGRVLTVDARDSVAQAIAVTAGKITAVGTDSEVSPYVGERTDVIDLRGRAVTPGLIDTHVHFSAASALYTIDLSDPAVNSIEAVTTRVREWVGKARPGEWIRGRGWDEGKLAERRYILAADLDKVAPNNPVWLTHTTGHYGVANSAALRLGKVTKDTPDPKDGTIDRDAHGNPTGVLKEGAQGLVSRLVPPLTRDQEKNGIAHVIEGFNREGMTAAKDPGLPEDRWELYQELLKEGRLNVRVFALWRVRNVEAARSLVERLAGLPRPPGSLGHGRLLAGGAKLAVDGSGGARTAWMHDEWNKDFTDIDRGNRGYPVIEPEVYRAVVRELHNARVHVSTHAIGDRAIDLVVDTYNEALKATPIRGLRHGIIHANTPTDRAIELMAALQKEYDAAYPEASAGFMWWIGDNYAGNLGPQRAKRLKPLRTFLRTGVRWSGGSDYGVTPYPARYGVWASVARETLNGRYGRTPFGTEEAVDVRTALRSYTLWAAHQLFLDDRVGSLEPGKEADLAVWDRDPYTVPTAALKDLVCEMTLVQGQIVYRRTGGSPSAKRR